MQFEFTNSKYSLGLRFGLMYIYRSFWLLAFPLSFKHPINPQKAFAVAIWCKICSILSHYI